MDKAETYKQLKTLERSLKETIGKDKESIINKVSSNAPKGKEVETRFISMFLSESIKAYFQDAIMESKTGKSGTFFKNNFFGSRPAPDFVINSIGIVGEVKYGKLDTQKLSTAIGQIMLYILSGRSESSKYEYGCVIFFDTSMKYQDSQAEKDFVKHMWENENIFLMII